MRASSTPSRSKASAIPVSSNCSKNSGSVKYVLSLLVFSISGFETFSRK
jgi:hypothetical protein